MDEDDHRRAEEEMNALSLRHLQRLKESQKFVNRLTALLYKLMVICLLVGLASVFSSQFPSQFPSFVRYVRRIIFSRTWDVVNVLLVAFAISYGVLARGALQNNGETEGGGGGGEIGGDAKFFDYESVNRRRDEQLSNAEENQAQSEAVESSIPAQMRRSRRNSYSYQDLSEAGRGGGDSNPRRAMDDTDWIRRSRRGSEDSAPKANGVPDFGMKLNGSEDSDKNSSGLKDYARDDATISSGFETPWQSEKPTSPPETEVKLSESSNFDFSAHIKYNVSTEEHRSRHPLAPPAPPPYPPPPPPRPPPPPPPPPPEKDSNPAPYQSEKRKSRPPSPPPPPPRPPPALETHLPKQRIRDTSDVSPHHRQDKSEKPKKMEKIKSDKKAPKIPAIITIPIPPIPPPLPTEILQHESRHRSSRSKEDSKHRSSRSKEESKDRSIKSKEDSKDRSSKDEHKQSRAAKDIANVLGLLSPSERKQKKIPSPPAPPPVPSTQPGLLSPSERKHKKIPSPPAPPPPPSTLQQWFSSYKRESKHKSKDSEHSPRHRSDKSRRKVHSSSSPPPPPPPPPAHIYTVDPKYHKRRTSEKRDIPKPPIYSTDSNYQRNVTSEKIEIPKTPVYSAHPKYQRNGASEENDMPKPRRDETSGNGDTFEYRKETVNVDTKVEEKEKLPERISSSIPLPPPPPPPFPMVEHQWPLYDDLRLQKRISSSSAELAESVPEPEPESEPEPERGWAFCFRKQFSLDNADSQFCPSPSPDEVNRKADAFIAKMRQQMRLQ